MANTDCISNESKGTDVVERREESNPPGWKQAGISDHFVQFYRCDDSLADAVAGFIGAGLRAVEGGIVVATKPHRQAIADRLRAQGLNLDQALSQRQYIALDADAALDTFMVDGMPNERLFRSTIGTVVTGMLSAGFRVRAFGEMVARLNEQGNLPAAVQLEQLWNDLGKTLRFSLYCAYPHAQFPGGENDQAFQHVCALHHRVIPEC